MLEGSVRAAAFQSEGLYSGVKQERALFLNRRYLVDINALHAAETRQYDLSYHTLGIFNPENPELWSPSSALDGGRLWAGTEFEDCTRQDAKHFDLRKVVSHTGHAPIVCSSLQTCAIKSEDALLPPAWYERRVGVRAILLPDLNRRETTCYVGQTPYWVERDAQPPEIGGITFLFRRNVAQTNFVVLHEPFENDAPLLHAEILDQKVNAVAVRVRDLGGTVNDRLFFQTHEMPFTEVTLEGSDEKYTFRSMVVLQIERSSVKVQGELLYARLPVEGQPEFILNGKVTPVKIEDGLLEFKP